MNQHKKKKIQKKKTKIEKNTIVLTQEEVDLKYEEEEWALNRELAYQRQATSRVEHKKEDLIKELETSRKDFNDILLYLTHHTEEEKKEIAAFDEEIRIAEENLNKQREIFESKVSDIEKKLGGRKKELESQKYNNEVTLQILDTFERERQDYLHKEHDLTQREAKQEKRHKTQVYQQDKSRRIDLQIVIETGMAKLEEVQRRIEESLDPIQVGKDMNEEKQQLEAELEKLAPVWQIKLKEKQEIQMKLQESENFVNILNKTIKLVNRTPRPDIETQVNKKQTEVTSTNIIVSAPQQFIIPKNTSEAFSKKDEIIVQLEQGIKLSNEIVKPEDFGHFDPEATEEEHDQIFERQTEILAEIMGNLNKKLAQKSEDMICEPPLAAVHRHTEKIDISRKPIERRHLWRNWVQPRFAARSQIHSRASIPIADIFKDHFTSKFIIE